MDRLFSAADVFSQSWTRCGAFLINIAAIVFSFSLCGYRNAIILLPGLCAVKNPIGLDPMVEGDISSAPEALHPPRPPREISPAPSRRAAASVCRSADGSSASHPTAHVVKHRVSAEHRGCVVTFGAIAEPGRGSDRPFFSFSLLRLKSNITREADVLASVFRRDSGFFLICIPARPSHSPRPTQVRWVRTDGRLRKRIVCKMILFLFAK